MKDRVSLVRAEKRFLKQLWTFGLVEDQGMFMWTVEPSSPLDLYKLMKGFPFDVRPSNLELVQGL